MYEKTEYFELVETPDLKVEGSHEGMIMYCESCKCFFSQKACGGRNIFPTTTVYHPTDGNCQIFADTTLEGRDRKYNAYECELHPVRIQSVTALNKALRHANKA